MKTVLVTAVCCVWLSTGLAQVSSTRSLPPTPLEAFVARPKANIKWSKTIGQLESSESRATVTALEVEDETSEARVMRGIRVDLSHIGPTPSCDWKYTAWRIMCQRENAAVYIEEGRLESVRDNLRTGSAQLRPMEFISSYSVESLGRTSGGLIVCGYQFSNRRTEDLAVLLARSMIELKATFR